MCWIPAVLLLVACPPTPKPPSPPPGSTTCADVCQHYAELGCPAAKPTAKGATCLDVCRNIVDSGVVTLNLECRARAASCAAADSCER